MSVYRTIGPLVVIIDVFAVIFWIHYPKWRNMTHALSLIVFIAFKGTNFSIFIMIVKVVSPLPYFRTFQNILMTLLTGFQVSDHCPLGYLFLSCLDKFPY